MARSFIALILIAGFLICPSPSITLAVKKACCCAPGSTSDCARHGDGKSDCCGVTLISVPLMLGLANIEIFVHPVQLRQAFIWSENYSTRCEAPPLPPPKVV